MKMFSTLTITALTLTGSDGVVRAQGAPQAKPPARPAAPAKPAPDMPKPPPELVAAAKAMAGTWRCTGNTMDMGGQPAAMTATMKSRADLDGFWIHDSFDGKLGKMKLKLEAFSTYDASSKKWRRVMISNEGAQSTGWSDGLKDNKMMWNLESIGPMGASMFRDYWEIVDARNFKASGEVSMDNGKTWLKIYDMACKK
ncbi:MAG: DUF1579 family protein [Kofleriaceae bacterium]